MTVIKFRGHYCDSNWLKNAVIDQSELCIMERHITMANNINDKKLLCYVLPVREEGQRVSTTSTKALTFIIFTPKFHK